MRESRKKKTVMDHLLTILLAVAIAVFAFAGYKLYTIYRTYQTGTEEYAALEHLAVKETGSGTYSDEAVESEEDTITDNTLVPPIEVDFEALEAVNEDVAGWLYVEALEISYPIVQGEDNEEYLHTTYEGTYNFAGSIFIDYENSPDFQDPNTIVYGHNMKNGSMFGTLKKIVSENACEVSPYFWILTPEHNYRYEIFAAYTTSVGSSTYTLFQKHDQEFEEYLQAMKSNSEIDTGSVEPDRTDCIATLSTCTGNSGSRFVVQGLQQE